MTYTPPTREQVEQALARYMTRLKGSRLRAAQEGLIVAFADCLARITREWDDLT